MAAKSFVPHLPCLTPLHSTNTLTLLRRSQKSEQHLPIQEKERAEAIVLGTEADLFCSLGALSCPGSGAQQVLWRLPGKEYCLMIFFFKHFFWIQRELPFKEAEALHQQIHQKIKKVSSNF